MFCMQTRELNAVREQQSRGAADVAESHTRLSAEQQRVASDQSRISAERRQVSGNICVLCGYCAI